MAAFAHPIDPECFPLGSGIDLVRILNVIGSVDVRNGGTTSHVFSISRIWENLGHTCHVLCLDPPDAACVAASPIKTIALGPSKTMAYLSRKLSFLRYGFTPALLHWLRGNVEEYDVVILNGFWNYTSLGCWRALKKSKVPYFICPHGMLDPWLKRRAMLRHLLRSAFWFLLESRVARDAHGVIFACEEEKRLACDEFLRQDVSTFVIRYGAEDLAADAGKSPAVAPAWMRNRRLILFLGRIHEKKGLDLLIGAFAEIQHRFPEFDLYIVGPDHNRLAPKLRKLAVDLNVAERIHWADMLVGQERRDAYRSAEFFVLPSHQENFGISITEAMAFSLPSLVTDKVNIWREVVEADAGICIPDTHAGVRNGLIEMCSLAPETRARMANNARRCFAEQFDVDKNARQFLALLNALTRGPNSRADGHDISPQSPLATYTSTRSTTGASMRVSAVQIGERQC